MKVRNLVKAYDKLLEEADDYFRAKVDLSKVENDYFIFFPVHIGESPTSKLMRMAIENTDENFNTLNSFFFEFDANEFDYFRECVKKGVESNLLQVSHDVLVKIEEPTVVVEACEDCGEVHPLEGH